MDREQLRKLAREFIEQEADGYDDVAGFVDEKGIDISDEEFALLEEEINKLYAE